LILFQLITASLMFLVLGDRQVEGAIFDLVRHRVVKDTKFKKGVQESRITGNEFVFIILFQLEIYLMPSIFF
jgi:hypothetical protein